MAGDMRRPGSGLEIDDVLGEGTHEGPCGGDAGQIVQIFIGGGQPTGPTSLVAVDQGQRHRPNQGGRIGQK